MAKIELHAPAPPSAEVNQLINLFNAGRHAELESRTHLLLKQYPSYGIAWHLLGESLQAQGKDGLHALQKAAALLPDDAAVHNNLGNALYACGQIEGAAASYRLALKINLGFAMTHSNLGNALNALGQFGDAVASCRRALELNPDYAEAHNNLGVALQALEQLAEAEACYHRALKIRPDYAEAHNNLCIILNALGQPDLAMASCRRALEINPYSVEAHNSLGNVLNGLEQFDSAVASYRRALELKPDYADAHSNLGAALQALGRLAEAEACCRAALKLKPDDAHAHSKLGVVLQAQGRLAEAESCYRHALELKPDYAEAYSNLLFTMNYSTNHTPASCLEQERLYGRMVAGKVNTRYSAWQCADSFERLRVGLVSGDLRNHPVGFFLESLLAQLDSARIELIAYPTNPIADELSARIKPYFSAWRPLCGLSDAAAARLIYADGVHILLDLSGHTCHNRLPVFAWKPAPVQASWLGYFTTTGVAEMDYLLADQVGVPDSQREHFSETVWTLPDTRLCFTPPDVDLPGVELPVAPLPALKNGHITFGCFQRLDKVEDRVLATWANLFSALPDARLRWQCKQLGDAAMVEQLTQRLQQHGMDHTRVAMHGAVSRAAYLNAHAEVDVLLDTFPYPGGTTTCEALWMGVPTLTLAGNTLLARQGASLLTAAGLENWVATSTSDYVDRALALTGDLAKLAALRVGLREQVRVSPLFDARRFARNLEEALWGMWQIRARKCNSNSH